MYDDDIGVPGLMLYNTLRLPVRMGHCGPAV